ncbi:DNA-directed RNA polymerase specialized sigma24 family protein [Streptosporangium album]|uniref:DNA-directed RNA polymerase specialized sigma24 family protein n=1 Tax=Streptosporangium album TaxID=47479 RepID=A0A7W7RTG4_9ACTN|nr:sigma factor [Streptosporangium album]MBB4937899.1 DNA-directed RNA polymerase specialized sigma24 family protein [Streptosporangium album]
MTDDSQRFTSMYDECRQRVWAYVVSRAGRQVADEVVSETFAIAWRRLDDVPEPALPWLLGVARNVLRDNIRAEVRRDALGAELRSWTEGDVAEQVTERLSVLRALTELPEDDREVLILTAWQGLSPRAAAHGAARQPDTAGAYWHTVSVSRNLFTAADADYTVVNREQNEGWTPSATGGEQWSRTRSLGAEPATPEDEAAWKQAGSPAEIPVTVPGKRGAKLTLSTEPGDAQDGHAPLVDGDKVFWLGRNVTMKDLRGLPSDPAGLKAWLLRSYEGHGTESSSDPMSSDAWLFAVTVGLFTDMPITPQVRGAAFQMLADLKTIKVVRDVTDAEGRTGTAVAIEERVKANATAKDDGGILQTRLIFDETTGQALARESVVVRPGGLQAAFAPGTVWNSEAVLEAGWTDGKPAA